MIPTDLYDETSRAVEAAEDQLAYMILADGPAKVSVRRWGITAIPERTAWRLSDRGHAVIGETSGKVSLTPAGHQAAADALTEELGGSFSSVSGSSEAAAEPEGTPPLGTDGVGGDPPPLSDPGAAPPRARVHQDAAS